MLRVASFTHEYPPFALGGTGTHVEELVQGLKKFDCETHVFSYAEDSSASNYNNDATAHFVTNGLNGSAPAARTLTEVNAKGAAAAAETYPTEQGPHIVHCHNCLAYGAAEATKELFRIPLVSTVHALFKTIYERLGTPGSEEILRSEAASCQGSDYLITVSKAMLEDIHSHYHIPLDRIRVIYNGFDLSRFVAEASDTLLRERLRQELASQGEPLVVFAGRVDPIKGVSALLHSAALVIKKMPKVKYIIAGDNTSSYARHIMSLAQRLGLYAPRFTFAGKLSRSKLATLYSIADLAVVPSIYEPFGYSAIEAMVFGVPVVASNTGGLSEIIEDGKNGLLVPVMKVNRSWNVDEHALADSQLALIADSAYRAKLGLTGRQRVYRRFQLEPMIVSTYSVYREIASREALHG